MNDHQRWFWRIPHWQRVQIEECHRPITDEILERDDRRFRILHPIEAARSDFTVGMISAEIRELGMYEWARRRGLERRLFLRHQKERS